MSLPPQRYEGGSADVTSLFVRALDKLKAITSSKKLDLEMLDNSIWALLDGNSVGFAYQLRQRSKPLISRQAGWAKLPNAGMQLWSQQTPMMIASLSKLFTAVSAVHLLDSEGISLDSKIVPHLPSSWTKGPGADQISFRDLLTHRSGLNIGGTRSSAADVIADIRGSIADGKAASTDYRNVNFTLLRLLMYLIRSKKGSNVSPPGVTPMPSVNTAVSLQLTDAVLEATSVVDFDAYTQSVLFEPAGVSASFSPPPDLAMYYTWPNPTDGVVGVDERLHAGANGWCMSVDDTLRAMAAFRRRGIALTKTRAAKMLSDGLGVDMIRNTGLGPAYAKNGGWGMMVNGITGTQQCVGLLLPQDMELVVFVNSNIGNPALFLMSEILDRYEAAIRPWGFFAGFYEK